MLIHVALLFTFMMSVLGFVPNMRTMHENGGEIAKMAMNKAQSTSHIFAPNARACFNGDCSAGIKVYDAYRDKFHVFSISYSHLIARGTSLYT